MGHVRMMAAVQPFISGAISKTVNMPEAATAEEIEQVYLEGWKQGLKAIAIYRDNSKRSQPLSTGKKKDGDAVADTEAVAELKRQLAAAQLEAGKPHRRRLPSERDAITHKFDIAGHEGYITVGLYPDGQPGEIFLKMAKEGSTVSGLMDTFATTVSVALQYGVPLRDLVNKFAHVRFEPSGFTGNQEIPIAKSIVDYIFRWLGSRFLGPEDKAMLGLIDRSAVVSEAPSTAGPRSVAGSGCPSALAPAAEEGLSSIDEAVSNGGGSSSVPTQTRSDPPADAPKATAVAAEPATARSRQGRSTSRSRSSPRTVTPMATPTGTPAATGTARQAGRHHDSLARRDQRVVQDPGGRTELRRMRLDHGPQRQLLQVPQLRQHERLLLTRRRRPGMGPDR